MQPRSQTAGSATVINQKTHTLSVEYKKLWRWARVTGQHLNNEEDEDIQGAWNRLLMVEEELLTRLGLEKIVALRKL